MKFLTRQGFLTEEEGMLSRNAPYDLDLSLAPLQTADCTYRIALGPRVGQHGSKSSMTSQYKHVRMQKSADIENGRSPRLGKPIGRLC